MHTNDEQTLVYLARFHARFSSLHDLLCVVIPRRTPGLWRIKADSCGIKPTTLCGIAQFPSTLLTEAVDQDLNMKLVSTTFKWQLPSLGLSQPVPRTTVNPRPAGVWLVTLPAGERGQRPLLRSPKLLDRFPNFKRPIDSPVRELPEQGQKFDLQVTDDVTGQVKVRNFDFSGLVTSASKISMLSANKANESAWIVSLTSASIFSCAL